MSHDPFFLFRARFPPYTLLELSHEGISVSVGPSLPSPRTPKEALLIEFLLFSMHDPPTQACSSPTFRFPLFPEVVAAILAIFLLHPFL